ncbi:histidine phosphatase family protein [Nonomuraea sp. NPDC049709]|uniref:histidine phosphatase family protein n=1 Tax=Nonomuraea sp. NPDC049709 TaxID=3154736 RepID=UPI00342B8B2E
MMIPGDFVLELVPHCASVPREGWAGDHDLRPLSEQGRRQAEALVPALGTGIDAIFSSPALRCGQTVRPLAAAAGRPVEALDTLAESGGFTQPPDWVHGVLAPMGGAVGGAYATGRMLRAVATMSARHPGRRVVAASHGDVIPVLLATLCAFCEAPPPALVGRGGWYTLRFDHHTVTITSRSA